MNIGPGATFEAVIDTGETGLVGTIGVEANDNEGVSSIAFDDTAIAELAPGIYSATGRVAPADEGQYTLIWRRGSGGEVLGIEDLVVTSSAPGEPPVGDAYATVDELFRILQIRNPTEAQIAAGNRVLIAAAGEINSEIDRDTDLAGWEVHLAAEVNLDRAVELWTAEESPFGFVGFGEALAVPTGRDTWERHAITLSPLKQNWGIS